MTTEHLYPHRGWTLLRDGGQFTPEEAIHLKDCETCTDWVIVFGELARHAAESSNLESPFVVTLDEHLTAERGWALIRDRGNLTLAEIGHLYQCRICNGWLASFASLAKKAGFPILFDIPEYEIQVDKPQADAAGA